MKDNACNTAMKGKPREPGRAQPTQGQTGLERVIEGFLQRRQASLPVQQACLALLQARQRNGSTVVPLATLQSAGIALDEVDPMLSRDGRSGVLVTHAGGVGFRRDWRQENAIANAFFATPPETPSDPAMPDEGTRLRAVEQLLPDIEMSPTHKQALETLATGAHLLISGGPGTGKTTALTRLLLFALMRQPDSTIGLCAPTGKAAQRMNESLRQGLQRLDWQALDTVAGPESRHQIQHALQSIHGQTVHRLLGHHATRNRVRHHRQNPLPHDLLVVDEASMLDLSQLHALVAALKSGAQLLLLGDANQLPPVGSGAPFADLCHLARQAKSQRLIELTRNYRFGPDSGIAKAATATLKGDVQTLIATGKSDGEDSDSAGGFAFVPASTRQGRKQALENWLRSLPEEAIKANHFKVLSATNHGPGSVAEANALVQEILFGKQVADPMHTPRENLPVMVLSNDYYRQVFNGDIGTMHWRNQQWMVRFESRQEAGGHRWLPLSALRQWQSAYAITIHKSQGSEYPWVLTFLEDSENTELADTKLLYTAITRASGRFVLVSSPATVQQVLLRTVQRDTFLRRLTVEV